MGKHPTQEKKAVAVYLLTKTDKPILEITTVPDLQREIKKLWCLRLNDTGYLQNLVSSMPRRLEAVIAAGGAATKY